MGEKIYTVLLDWAFDGESGNEIHGTYRNFEDAKLEFNAVVEKENENWEEDDKDIVIEHDETSWTAYKDGWYNDYHTFICITESQLK